jgi:hypothetical protein
MAREHESLFSSSAAEGITTLIQYSLRLCLVEVAYRIGFPSGRDQDPYSATVPAGNPQASDREMVLCLS